MAHVAPKTAPSRHDAVLGALGARIVDGRIAVGARLNSADLARDFGMARGAMREVVRVLESLGLVRSRRRAGIEVLPAEHWHVYAPQVIRWRLAGPARWRTLHELSELRAAVEPAAARLAAARSTREQRRFLTDASLAMAETMDRATEATYLGADVAFHRTMLQASGNPMFASLADVVEEVLTGRTRHALMPAHANPEAVHLHQDIALHVSRGEGAAAAAAMARIVGEADEAVAQMAGAEGARPDAASERGV